MGFQGIEAVSLPLAEINQDSKGGNTRSYMDNRAACKVQGFPGEKSTTPDPVADRGIDEKSPECDECDV